MRGREIFSVGAMTSAAPVTALSAFLIYGAAIEDNAVRWFDLVSHLHRNGDRTTETNSGLELQIGAVSAKLGTPAAGIRAAQLA